MPIGPRAAAYACNVRAGQPSRRHCGRISAASRPASRPDLGRISATSRQELGRKIFTNGTDHEIVVRLYQRAFAEVTSTTRLCPRVEISPPSLRRTLREIVPAQVFAEVTELDFRGFEWTSVERLVEVLREACPPHLQRVLLNNNKIGLADAISLCEARSPPEQSSHAHCTVVITPPSRHHHVIRFSRRTSSSGSTCPSTCATAPTTRSSHSPNCMRMRSRWRFRPKHMACHSPSDISPCGEIATSPDLNTASSLD